MARAAMTGIACLLVTQCAGASISQKDVVAALMQDPPRRWEQLHHMGADVYTELRRIALASTNSLGTRWQAFMTMAQIGEKDALPDVEEGLKSKDWFIRDAAIKVLPILDRHKAYDAAVAALKDKAMVVRSAAVDCLHKLRNIDASEPLWAALNDKENYLHGRSLWIRRQIVETLADIATEKDKNKFLIVLSDADSTLFAPAIAGLQRLTGQTLGPEHEPALFKRHRWQKWFAENEKNAKP